MKFRALFYFECRYQLRNVSTWLLFAVFFLFGFLLLRMVTLDDGTHLNAPGTIAFFTIFASIIWVLIGGVVAGEAATRDIQTGIHPLTYTTPVTKAGYLGARFLAALVLNALILLCMYAGILFSYYGPGAKTEFLAPFRFASYLTNYGFLVLPTVFVCTALQFCFAALSGRAIASYIASMLLIVFSQFGGTTVRFLLEWKLLGSLMDLLGTSIMADMEGWTPIEKNSRLVLLEGSWLWNRITWFIIAVCALSFTYLRFKLAHLSPAGWFRFLRRRPVAVPSQTSLEMRQHVSGTSTLHVPEVTRDFVFATFLQQSFAIAGKSFLMIAKSRGGLTLVALLAIGTGLFATEYMEWLGVPLQARTQEVIRILAPSIESLQTQWIIIPLLTIFYAGDLVWRERDAGLHELFDTSPLPEWVMFLGKFMGLALIISCWMVLLLLAGIINQLVMDYHNFEIDVYIKALFGIQLTNYFLFALLVFVIHVLVHQKYIGHMIAMAAYGYLLFSSIMGIEHHMLVYASDPGWSYSDMRGFGPFMQPWLWFKFYWASWALLLAVIAVLFWGRTKESSIKARMHLAQLRFTTYKRALFIALAVLIASGGYVFYNTNILHAYLNKGDQMELRAAYEKLYGKFEQAAQPALARTMLHVAIYPEQERADIHGTYHLVNRSQTAIDSIHLSTIPHLQIKTISFDRKSAAVVEDNKRGYRIYALEHAVAPGDSIQINFSFQIHDRGFSNDGANASVVANGSHISSDWMPVIGYNENRRLHEPKDRAKYGLSPKAARPSLYDTTAQYDTRHAEVIHFEAVVSTAADQVAVAPGNLLRTWTNGKRKYFHYATNAPIQNEYAFFSARYAVREAQWIASSQPSKFQKNNSVTNTTNTTITTNTTNTTNPPTTPVTIQIYYHPSHGANIERMLKSVQASLQYYSDEFGPYPYSVFRVLERPGAGRGMHAEPMTIDYEEGYALMQPAPNGLDLPYHIMAHEVAHQWWGFQLRPAAVEGSGLLVESFATYSAMQVVEKTLGYEHLLRYLSQMRLEYEVPRSLAAPPLIRANNAFMNYRKGPFALFALRNYTGKEKVNHAMRQLLYQYGNGAPLPTTLDFYRELQAVTPDSLQYLVHDLFAANSIWVLKTEEAAVQQTAAGTWQVQLELQARKVTVDSMGREKNIPMQEWIEVGVYGARKDPQTPAKLLYLQKHRVRSGRQTIQVDVPEKPVRAGIDPNHLLIDFDPDNNTRIIKVDGAGG